MTRRRDVVLARVHFHDSPESKVRPCIVLSDEKYHEFGFVLVAAITTAGDEYCMPISAKDADCELAPYSGARFDGIIKLSAKGIFRKIGTVAPEFHSKLVGSIEGLIK